MEESNNQRSYKGLLLGMTLGTACGVLLMYYLDPQRGRTRRALTGAKFYSYNKRFVNRSTRIAEDLKNRVYGKFHEIQHRREASKVEDAILLERVRAAIGRKVSHMKALTVFVNNGEVQLIGPILKSEVPDLLRTIGRIPGVHRVRDELSKYDPTDITPDLQ